MNKGNIMIFGGRYACDESSDHASSDKMVFQITRIRGSRLL